MLSKKSIKINKTFYEAYSVNIQTRIDFDRDGSLCSVFNGNSINSPLIDISISIDTIFFEDFKKLMNSKFEFRYTNIIAEGCLVSEIIYNVNGLLEIKIINDYWRYLDISDIRDDKLNQLGI